MLAISDARGPEAAQITVDMGEVRENFDRAAFTEKTSELVNRFQGSTAQDVEVGLVVAELGRSSIRYRIGIFAEGSGSAAAEGDFVHVVVDRASRRPVEIPASWRRKLETFS